MTDVETEELAESAGPAVTHGTLYIMREQDYLSGDLFDYYKIGIVRGEKDVKKRETEHSTANPRKISSIVEIQSPEVQKLETHLHNTYAMHRVSSGEWFFLPGDLLDQVTNDANQLAEKLAQLEAVRAVAAEVVKQAHDAPAIQATDEFLELGQQLAHLRKQNKEASAIKTKIVNRLREIAADDEAYSYLFKVREVKATFSWDGASFKKENKEIDAQFRNLVTTKWTPKWLQDFAEDVYDTALVTEIVELSDPLGLHAKYLEFWKIEAQAKWEIDALELQIHAATGTAQSLEGVVEWTEKSATGFDKESFKAAYPDLYEKYLVEKPAVTQKTPAEWASYAH